MAPTGDSRIGENHVDLSILLFDRLVQMIQIGQLATSLWTAVTFLPISAAARSSAFLAPAGDEHMIHPLLDGRYAYEAEAAS